MTLQALHPLLRNRVLVHLLARPRLFGSVLLGLCLYPILPDVWGRASRVLLAWNIATWFYVVLAAWMMSAATHDSIRQRAQRLDESRFVVLALAILASLASFGAIFAELAAVKDVHGVERSLRLTLAAATIVSAWVFIHLIFAQHYAHEFYVERDAEKALPEDARGGLQFPSTPKPHYLDFVYFSFVIGCAAQTADVATTSGPMRALTLAHGVLAFFFNTTILALTINIGSGLIS